MRKTRNPSARAPLSNVQHPRNRPEKPLHRPRGAPPGGRSRPDPAGGAVVGRDMQDVVPESRRVPAAAAAVAMCGTSSTTATMPVSGASGRDTPTGVPTPEKV